MRTKSIAAAAEAADREVARGHYLAAKELNDKALEQTSDPAERAVLSYNLGQLHWQYVGDGTQARHFLQSAVESCGAIDKPRAANGPLVHLEANACENLMLLSLSYQEFDSWRGRLNRLWPVAQEAAQWQEWVEEMGARARRWSDVMLANANRFFHQDPNQDPGLYPRAAAIFQLMLTHRRQLRLRRRDMVRVTGAYSEQILRTLALCEQAMQADGSPVDRREFVYILRDALPLVEESAKAAPADEGIQELVQALKQAWDMVTGGETTGSAAAADQPAEAEIPRGTILAENFAVIADRPGQIPKDMERYVSQARVLELEARYENHSRLSLFRLSSPPPPAEQWPLIVPEGFQNISVKKSWMPPGLEAPSVAVAYKAQTSAGHNVALINMMTATEDVLVLAAVSWYGGPLSRFRGPGFKPGMEERTQELLLAGKELCQRIGWAPK